MTENSSEKDSRRNFLKTTGIAAGAIAGVASSQTHLFAGENNTMQIALVGCGGRGGGATQNALATQNGPIKLVAMADAFQDRLDLSFKSLKRGYEKQMDVPKERQFVGFDAYKKAMDCLNPGDVVILTTPPAFRWVHFTYAIEKGLNVFMEKPVTVDGPTTRRMLALAKEADKKNLKVGVGLMCRHSEARIELKKRIDQGAIGDILEMRAYRMVGPTGSAATKRKPDGMSEVEYQIRNFHGFLWASGGAYSDFNIHNIDECCMLKGAWPVKADGSGGRHYRDDCVDQNFDSYSVEYTFADGTKLWLRGRNIVGCTRRFASFAHGTKGSAVISTSAHHPARSKIYTGHNMEKKHLTWHFPGKETTPYQLEWENLTAAIRNNTPYNEVPRGAIASLVTSMGRMAAHTGRMITYDQILNHDHEFAPNVDKLTMDGPAPVQADKDGDYPHPAPGITTKREY